MNKTIVAVVVVILAVAGGIGYMVMKNGDKDKNTDTSQTHSEDTNQSTTPQQEENAAGEQPAQDTESTNAVTIQSFAFGPNKITVKKGTTVTWTNKDSVKHNVTPDNEGSASFKEGPLLAEGETYTVTFNEVGSFSYHCDPHPQMKGTVVVTE